MASPGVQSERSKVNFFRYFDGIFVVTKKEMYRVFLWLYQGDSQQYVGDYLKNELPGVIKRLGSMEKRVLFEKQDSPVTFDISMLYMLCQYTCGLTDHKDRIWKNPTTPEERGSLEHSLYLLKEKRNKLCHDPGAFMQMTTEDLDNHIDELRRLCVVILRESGQRAGRPTTEILDYINKVKEAFDEIKTKSVPSGMTAREFGLMGSSEMRKKHTPSPVDGNFIFPSLQNKGEDGSYRRNIEDFLLWQSSDGSNPKAIVLSGDTGTGKTAICGHIYDSWISNNTDISLLDDFDLVVPVQCCSVSTRDVLDFLRGFMEDTHSLCARDEISSFLKSLKILWLFDGFEEATKNAIELLKQIPQYQGTSSLVLITTQPQRLQDLINKKLIITETTIVAQLLGFSDDGVENFLKTMLSGKEGDFFKDVKDLSKDLLQELRVPLKLKLMMALWKDGKLKKESGTSVYFLYKSIIEAHEEKITEKLQTETKLEDEDIRDRVRSWFYTLCKAAFEMILNNQLVKINSEYQEQLEKAAECLIYPKDCLSVYLQSESTSQNISYSFIHGTQQIYLAAQYVFCVIQEECTFPQELNELFNMETSQQNRQSDYILHSLLLQVVSSVAQHKNVKANIAKELVHLLSTFRNDFNAFEVIRHAAYDSVFTEEVSKYSGQMWKILDDDIKAAMVTMQYATPTSIRILIEKNPHEARELALLLQLISKRDVELELCLIPHAFICDDNSDTSDNYLKDLWSTDAKCHVRSFTGCLSKDTVKNLTKMKDIEEMTLKVTSNKLLHQILINLKFLKNLENLFLVFMMPVVTVPSSHSFDVRINDLKIALPCIDETKVNETADAISNISKHYKEIRLHDISSSSAVQFIRRLQKRNIRVNAIVRELFCFPFNISGSFVINYGCVPLIQPIEVFDHQWQNTRLETYEDDLGIKRLRLITTGDIPDPFVVFVDSQSLANPRVMKFLHL